MRDKFFHAIARVATIHPWRVLTIALILTAVSSVYSIATIHLNANSDELVSKKLAYHKRYIDFLREFGDEEYLYVVIDAKGDDKKAKRFITELAGRLNGISGIKQIIWKVDNPVLEKNFMLYLSIDELKTLDGMLTSGPFAVKNITSWNGFAPMFSAFADRMERPVFKGDEDELSHGFSFLDGLVDDMSDSINGVSKPYKSRIQRMFFGKDDSFDTDGFYRNGDLFFILLMPEKNFGTLGVIEKPLKEIRYAIADTRSKYSGVTAGLTGRPVLEADEMLTSNRDMTRATILAFILVGILFIIAFRSVSRPLLAVASLAMGISWTFGLVAIVFGFINILSIVFTLILIGASIEYGIHIVARYQEELARNGGDVVSAITSSLTTSGRADVTSALTTAAAFLTLLWTDFTALAQLGFIAASGILFCLMSMLIVLPAMLVLCDGRRNKDKLVSVKPFGLSPIAFIYKKPWVVGIIFIVITAVSVPFLFGIKFDNNLLNLQAKGLESVRFEHMIFEKSSETTWFARSVANDIATSHKKAIAFSKLASVRRVDDVERILPEHQSQKIGIVRKMAPAFDKISFKASSKGENIRDLAFQLGRISSAIGSLENAAFRSGRVDAVEELDKFGAKIKKLAELIKSADKDEIFRLNNFKNDFFADLHKQIGILVTGMHPTHISLSDIPDNILRRFVSSKGRYALFIYPKENIWNPDALKRFVNDIRSVNKNVLGTPIEVYESGRIMRGTFMRSAVLAFILICILAWLDFRSIRAAALAVMPLAVGIAWLVGFMGLFRIPFNMANFFSIPILIGIGVDFGVHIVHRISRSQSSSEAILSSTGGGVFLTAMTNAVGFGTMMMASHRGIASLGRIMAIGSVCCLIAVMVALPLAAKSIGFARFNNR